MTSGTSLTRPSRFVPTIWTRSALTSHLGSADDQLEIASVRNLMAWGANIARSKGRIKGRADRGALATLGGKETVFRCPFPDDRSSLWATGSVFQASAVVNLHVGRIPRSPQRSSFRGLLALTRAHGDEDHKSRLAFRPSLFDTTRKTKADQLRHYFPVVLPSALRLLSLRNVPGKVGLQSPLCKLASGMDTLRAW